MSMSLLKSRGLIDESFVFGDYVNIDFEVCTSEMHAMTDQEILDSVLSNYCAEEEEEKDEESEANDVPHEKPKLSEVAGAIELLECWSLFENSGGETGSHFMLYRKGLTNSLWKQKSNPKCTTFSKNCNIDS